MRQLFQLFIPSLIALLVLSCSPARVYYQPLTSRPSSLWEGTSGKWGGYTETKSGRESYKIGYETFNEPGPEFGAYFAKVRAAERAVLDGQSKMYLSSASQEQDTEVCHFPAYTRSGYWTTRRDRHYYYDCEGKRRYHWVTERYFVPPVYVPPHTALNKVYKNSLRMSYRPVGEEYLPYSVLYDALSDGGGFGVPKLDPRVMRQVKSQ